MASRRFDAICTKGLQRVRIGGSFRPAGTGAPTNVIGQGFTVARTGTGQYTITFQDTFFALDEVEGSVRVSDASFAVVTFGAYNASAKTLILQVYNIAAGAAAALDLSANANNVINFHALFRNTGVNY